jgi:hypothetical protein
LSLVVTILQAYSKGGNLLVEVLCGQGLISRFLKRVATSEHW